MAACKFHRYLDRIAQLVQATNAYIDRTQPFKLAKEPDQRYATAGELVDERRGDFGVEPFGLLDCTVQRNGYGRQIDSFTAPVGIERLDGSREPFPAVFIRAPRITRIGPEVEILAEHEGEPVVVRRGSLLGLTFHPELTDDLRIHRVFLEMVGRA